MKSITVFTPAYNRAGHLKNAYQSLKCQTLKDFCWLIIDDGSTDNTAELVAQWKADGAIDIDYHWKPNEGMHTAHNLALALIDTNLCCCLDSDDDLSENAIEIILHSWDLQDDTEGIAGMILYESFRDSGKIIGTGFPKNMSTASFKDLYYKYHIKGDKFLVYRHSVLARNPYPVFEGERYVPLDYKYLLINEELALIRASVYNKEYLSEGHSKNIVRIYSQNPRAYIFYHNFRMRMLSNFLKNLKSCIHLTACHMLIGDNDILNKSPNKLFTLLTFPVALIWYFRLKREKNY